MGHAARDLLGILDHGQDVEVRRERGDGTEGEVVVSLASSEDAEDEVVERRSGAEEEASLDGAAGDEDESSRGGDVAKSSGHTYKERKKSLSSLIRSSPTCDKPCTAGLQKGIPAGPCFG